MPRHHHASPVRSRKGMHDALACTHVQSSARQQRDRDNLRPTNSRKPALVTSCRSIEKAPTCAWQAGRSLSHENGTTPALTPNVTRPGGTSIHSWRGTAPFRWRWAATGRRFWSSGSRCHVEQRLPVHRLVLEDRERASPRSRSGCQVAEIGALGGPITCRSASDANRRTGRAMAIRSLNARRAAASADRSVPTAADALADRSARRRRTARLGRTGLGGCRFVRIDPAGERVSSLHRCSAGRGRVSRAY